MTDLAVQADGEHEAEAALNAYLVEFGLRPGGHLERLVGRALARARAKSRYRPASSLAAIALAEAEGDVAAWAVFVLGEERIGAHPPVMLARAAYQACGGPEAWPDVLLVYELPEAFVEAMRRATPTPTPPEQQGAMTEQPLETWSLSGAMNARGFGWLRNTLADR